MNIKKIALVSLLSSTAIIGGCDLEDEPKKLNPDQIYNAILLLNPEELHELTSKYTKEPNDEKWRDMFI
ncbi:MAG: hypothetical protein C4617_03890 [Candidatus Liberibacter europaeus]|uniref:Uncharacterized protein n=1 Tax=Candidatus Liberibacter europaeus TaxID=744859 RepID=A0A2T4VX51_9HYPH|nr:hypothetical protein [Candidatus Liberibacter europaeus]PTL86353.1 MAG: hypothetical protein C4617_03890 [Candidatus Liberibacter europaeus]